MAPHMTTPELLAALDKLCVVRPARAPAPSVQLPEGSIQWATRGERYPIPLPPDTDTGLTDSATRGDNSSARCLLAGDSPCPRGGEPPSS